MAENTHPTVPLEPASTVLPRNTSEDPGQVLRAAGEILAQGESLLRTISAENYSRRVPIAFNASIGAHYRHCLNHFTSLLNGIEASEVNYDHRERDERVESVPQIALELTQRLRSELDRLPLVLLNFPVRVRCSVSYVQGNTTPTQSTIGRELVYAITHAIHHFALISILARLMESALPEHFGVAPSTLAQSANPASR
jgi:hypothetical protein